MYKIAIVDDEQEILNILERFLTRNFEVVTFINPLSALNSIKSGNFDLVLTDIMMPQMDGLELLKDLRANNCDVNVVMMTAFDTITKALEAHEYGAKNYIKKPFKSLPDVLEKVNLVLK